MGEMSHKREQKLHMESYILVNAIYTIYTRIHTYTHAHIYKHALVNSLGKREIKSAIFIARNHMGAYTISLGKHH